jgi:hypothetical protein
MYQTPFYECCGCSVMFCNPKAFMDRRKHVLETYVPDFKSYGITPGKKEPD